ncbi:peptidylprolyl isomerase, partial [Escherichia coli]
RLIGLAEGAHERFELPAGEAFGERNPELLQRVKLSLLRQLGDPDEAYHVGDVVQFPGPDGPGGYAGV